MIRKSSLNQAYQLIKRNRLRRKMKMYQLAFGVLVDRTTAFYLLLLGGYIIVGFFIVGDFINDYYEQFMMVEEFAASRFWLILTILPLRYLNQSFSKPGVMFSSSEYQLSLLPYSRRDIWLRSVFGKWLKLAIIYMVIGSLIILITPISFSLVLKYMLLFICFDVLMTMPQWKLYQRRALVKIAWLCLMLVINFIGVMVTLYTDLPIVGMILFGLLVFINIHFKDTLFKEVNWNKVTEVSDFELWNMWLISKASEVKITRQKKYSMFQKIGMGKKSFIYQEKKIYNRLWIHYLGKNFGLLIQAIGAIFIMLIVFLFFNDLLFYIGLAIAIYVYTTVLAIFFKDRFEADLLRVLPWDLSVYKQSYFKWAIIGGIVLLIPIRIFLALHASTWIPVQLLFYCSAFLYIYHVKIDKAIILLGKGPIETDLREGISILILVGIVFSWKYPAIALSFIIIILLLIRQRISHA